MKYYILMHVITKKRLEEFSKIHPDCRNALETWYRVVKNNNFNSFNQLREYFPSADLVGNFILTDTKYIFATF
ncbi:mRNA interferase HigB [Candidatus Magnetomoraceae bacterium gMMP-13]